MLPVVAAGIPAVGSAFYSGGTNGYLAGGSGGSFASDFAIAGSVLAVAGGNTNSFGQVHISLHAEPLVRIPEPASLVLFGAGLLGLALVRRRKA